ncbi:MAG: DNA polymerase I [Clostridia bacterium]|nr:DNA polymerase I [Clostridia bacterium]
MTKKLLLVDGNSIINRAFYGCKTFLTSSSGIPTGAVNGFFNSVYSVIDEYKPTDICVLFDLKAPTFRHKMSKDYKATRKPMDPDLAAQMPVVKELLDVIGIKRMELAGFEADDLIGTLSRLGEEASMEVFIYSGDHDDYQLISDKTSVVMPCSKKGMPPRILYDKTHFEEENGVTPEQFIFVKALMGDSSDNIIGIEKIGPKTAFSLIQKYGDIEGVLSHINELTPAQQKNLTGAEEKLDLNLKLCTIDRFVPVPFGVESTTYEEIPDKQACYDRLMEYSLKSLAKKLKLDNLTPTITEDVILQDGFVAEVKNSILDYIKLDKSVILNSTYVGDDIEKVVSEINSSLEKNAGDEYPVFAISFNKSKNKALFTTLSDDKVWITSCDLVKEVLDSVSFEKYNLKPQLASYDFKETNKIMKNAIDKKYIIFDTKICAYILNIIEGAKITFNDTFERTAVMSYPFKKEEPKQLNMLDMLEVVDKAESSEDYYLSDIRDLKLTLLMSRIQADRIKEQNVNELIYGIELPLIHTLDSIERDGMHVSSKMLSDFHNELTDRIKKVEEDIYCMAGEEFNISSPKQLSVVLFEKLQLPAGKKSKTGSYSTSVEELNKLRSYSPIIDHIILYRKLTKLDSTYAVGLKPYIDDEERIHTTFTQAMTNTGRLSSLEPNLQNIPVKTDDGGRIREAFTAPDGRLLVDADYSQIELRLLAHLSGDKVMCDSFNSDADIHTSTAVKLYGVPEEFVTSKMRSAAKTVNFSIIYGITPFGLSNDLGISFGEAKALIEEYHKQFSEVTSYLEGLKKMGETNGYVDTMFGRRRYINEFKSSNHQLREFGYRAAMNTPIQGSAADIIKLAMNAVDETLRQKYPNAKFVMQVHDEVIIECDSKDAEDVASMVKSVMESVVKLNIPLRADVGIGSNWLEAK